MESLEDFYKNNDFREFIHKSYVSISITEIVSDFIKENDIIFKMNIQDKRSKKNDYTQI